MKILKSAVIAFSLAAAIGSFSTAAVAETDKGRIAYKPVDAVNGVLESISAAEAAINNGADGKEVAALIKKASDLSEEINANDKVSRENSKVRSHLKAAAASAKAANLQEAKEHLGKAKVGTEGLKKLI